MPLDLTASRAHQDLSVAIISPTYTSRQRTSTWREEPLTASVGPCDNATSAMLINLPANYCPPSHLQSVELLPPVLISIFFPFSRFPWCQSSISNSAPQPGQKSRHILINWHVLSSEQQLDILTIDSAYPLSST